MIREKIYRDIIATIDMHSRFESAEFKIESVPAQRNNDTILSIKYTIDQRYKIAFRIPSSMTKDKDGYSQHYTFSGNVCPGPLSYEENFSFTDIGGIFKHISIWLDCIWEELSSMPVVKMIDNQQQIINEIFEKLDHVSDDYFSVDEANELKKRLDELEEKLKKQIRQNEEDKNVFEHKIDKLHTDIDTLKQTIHTFKKNGWIKSFTIKVYKWVKNSENRAMLKDGYAVIRDFLPEEIKNALPEAK
jgi:polyhydroxyalkanoate synthesis regulator phasin